MCRSYTNLGKFVKIFFILHPFGFSVFLKVVREVVRAGRAYNQVL